MPSSNKLQATSLWEDPRLAAAKQLLIDSVAERQRQITGIRPANPVLKQNYQDMLTHYAENRGVPLWFPFIGSGIGNGAFVELLDGSIKYDFITGIGVHFFGHSHPALIEASIDAALSDVVVQGNLQPNQDSIELTQLLIEAAKLPHCFLSSSGAMAVENALKISFQKRFPSQRLLAFERCFAGRTLALSQINDKPAFRQGLPPTVQVDYIPFFDPLHPEESCHNAIQALKKQISRHPKNHAAMIFELVQGEGGFYPGTTAFFTPLMQLCKENQITVIVDEIQTFGRTPELFAFHHFDLHEYVDICTIGKLSQVCATLFTEEFIPKVGLLSQTFTSSTAAMRCSLAILKMLMHSDLYGQEGKISRFHALFVNALNTIANRHPGILKGPFGVGAMIAFTALEGEEQQTKRIIHALFEEGLICFMAGSQPSRVRMLPPVPILSEDDILAAAAIIETVLKRFVCTS